MQNAATMADGTLITVLCLCQGDRYQNWIVPPLNFSMCEFVSSGYKLISYYAHPKDLQ